MDAKNHTYTAYLLRFWREADGSLRATVQNPHSGERFSFANQNDLSSFLAEKLQGEVADAQRNNQDEQKGG